MILDTRHETWHLLGKRLCKGSKYMFDLFVEKCNNMDVAPKTTTIECRALTNACSMENNIKIVVD